MKRETLLALELLRAVPEYIADARIGAPVGNSVVGSLLSLPPHSIPRQYAEAGVLEALRLLDAAEQDAADQDDDDTDEFTLPRTGRAPLKFRGAIVVESDGERQFGRDQNRYHQLTVYRTVGGRYVLAVQYRTRHQGEPGRDEAWLVQADRAGGVRPAMQVAALLSSYDPTAPVYGYPRGDHYAAKQEVLLRGVRERYLEQCSEVLGQLPEAAVEIP